MMSRNLLFMVVLFAVSLFAVSAYATLVDMCDGTIYDTDKKLSWLKDANYAMTSGVITKDNGLITWYEANLWALSLNAWIQA